LNASFMCCPFLKDIPIGKSLFSWSFRRGKYRKRGFALFYA